MKNRIIDLHKRAGRRPSRVQIPENIKAPGASPEDEAIAVEDFERYERALGSLKDDNAIVLRVELGLDYEEVAMQLGKPSSAAARMAVTRAIVRLADKMGRNRRRDSPDLV